MDVFDDLCLNKGTRTRNENNDLIPFVCCLKELALSGKSKGALDGTPFD
jgi:hypothetical protein